MNIKKFINRNAPVFIIGGITLVVFLLIIGLAQNNETTPTKLIEANQSELIAAHTYTKGATNPKVTIVEFSDFGCPACKQWQPVLESVLAQFPNDVKLAFRHYPLPQHKNADKAAVAAQAAGEQNKFWEYATKLYENQGNFSDEQLASYAQQIGLNASKFENDYKNGGFESLVKSDMQYGNELGVQVTPTIFVNGKQVQPKSFEDFVNSIKAEVEKVRKETNDIDSTPVSIFPGSQSSNSTSQTDEKNAALYNKVDGTWGIVTINYREAGFDPKSTQLFSGQLVRWINNTDKEIALEQTMSKFDEFKEPIKIAPGEMFEFRIYDSKIWTYQEANTKSFGSIFIKPRPAGFDDNL